jgi:predicted transcriptional regulator
MGMEMQPGPYHRSGDEVPREVRLLLRREREIAMIVYQLGAATANQVQNRLSKPLANASVRSMMNRLVRKGILTRWQANNAFIYMPALTFADSRRLALTRFADDYFAGSIQVAAAAMKRLIEDG